jgi:hypothetical protein
MRPAPVFVCGIKGRSAPNRKREKSAQSRAATRRTTLAKAVLPQ